MAEEHDDHDGQKGELDARVLVPLYCSADRRFRKWEDVVLDSFACNYEGHLVTCRDESGITAVYWLPCTTSLRWTHCVRLLAFVGCRVPTVAGADQFAEVWPLWEEQARQIQSFIDAYSDPDDVSCDDLEMPWCRVSASTLPAESRTTKELNLLNDDSADVSGGMLVVLAATVLVLEAKSRLQGRTVLDLVKLTRAAVEVVGTKEGQWSSWPQNDLSLSWPQRWVIPAALRRVGSGGLSVGAAVRVSQKFSSPS